MRDYWIPVRLRAGHLTLKVQTHMVGQLADSELWTGNANEGGLTFVSGITEFVWSVSTCVVSNEQKERKKNRH